MKHLLLFMLCCSASFVAKAQIPLHGIVTTMQNNRTKNYVRNAQIESPVAQPATSDDNGRFVLQISEVQMGYRAPIYVFLSNDYKDYVVVNEKDLKEHTLGADTVKAYICRADELEKQKAGLVDLNMNNYVEKKQYDRMRKRLQQELNEVKSRSVRYKEIIDSLSLISEDEDRMLKIIEEFADKLVRINLDNIRETDAAGISRRKAYECALRGELDSVMFYMHDREQLLREALKKKEEAQKVQEAARQLEAAAKTAEQQQTETVNELIKDMILMAQTAKAQNNHAEAERCYLLAIEADTLNYYNIFDFAVYLYEIREYAKAEKYYQSCLQHYEKLVEDNLIMYLPDLATILNRIGLNYDVQHKYSKAGECYIRCLEIREQLVQYNPQLYLPDLAIILNNIGSNCYSQHEYSKAGKYYIRCLEIYEHLSKDNPQVYLPDIAMILNNIGSNYYSQHEYSKVEEYYIRCLEIREQLSQDSPKVYLPDLAGILYNIGLNYCSQHEYSKAGEYYIRCLEISEQLSEDNPKAYLPDLAGILNNIGINYDKQHEYSKAEKYLIRCLEIREQLAKDNPQVYLPDLAGILNNIGNNYNVQHEYSKAGECYIRCLEIWEQLVQDNPKVYLSSLADILNNIGNNYNDQHEYSKAGEYYIRCLEIREQLSQESPKVYLPDLAGILYNIGSNYKDQHEYSRTVEYYFRSMEIYEQLVKDNPKTYLPVLMNAYGNLSWYYLFTKEYILSEQSALKGLEADSSQVWIKTYLAHALLFQHRYTEAEVLYKELSQTIYKENDTFTQTILDDFDALEKAGVIPEERNEDVEKIRTMLAVRKSKAQ
jgi:tetratricopeptide (TPR) repeat protein